jgi:hypothetical protein
MGRWGRALVLFCLVCTGASICPSPDPLSNETSASISVLLSDAPLTDELTIVAGKPVRIDFIPSVIPLADVNILLDLPLGYTLLEHPGTDGVASIILPAGSPNGTFVTLSTTGEVSASPFCFKVATSDDEAFSGVSPLPAGTMVASTIFGTVRIGVLDASGLLVAPPTFRVFASPTNNTAWPGQWPHAVELEVQITRNTRRSLSEARLPILVPLGWRLDGFSEPFLNIPKLPDSRAPGSSFPDRLRFVPTGVSASPTRPACFTFGPVVSTDPQWNGVVPDVAKVHDP